MYLYYNKHNKLIGYSSNKMKKEIIDSGLYKHIIHHIKKGKNINNENIYFKNMIFTSNIATPTFAEYVFPCTKEIMDEINKNKKKIEKILINLSKYEYRILAPDYMDSLENILYSYFYLYYNNDEYDDVIFPFYTYDTIRILIYTKYIERIRI